jgi:drug/metabolite transporter (DMT)-like permease
MSAPAAPASSTPLARPLFGAAWMLASGLGFVGVTVVIKMIGDAVPPAQSAFVRYALGLVFILPVLPALLALRLDRRVHAIFAIRGAAHSFGVIAWFFAIGLIPLAEVQAINYLNPVFVTLGAALFLGERLAVRRVLAISVAILGVLVVLRPGFREISPGHLAMIVTAFSFAASYVIAKPLVGRASPGLVVSLLSIWVTVALAPWAALVWVPIGWANLGWLFLTACLATFAHYAMTRAFVVAPVAMTQPVTFLQLVWSVLFGLVLFGEALDGWVILGAGLIVGAVSYITWRESVTRRQAAAAGPPAP